MCVNRFFLVKISDHAAGSALIFHKIVPENCAVSRCNLVFAFLYRRRNPKGEVRVKILLRIRSMLNQRLTR